MSSTLGMPQQRMLWKTTVIIEFEFDPLINLDTSLGFDVRLTWSQVSSPNSGVIEAANCKYYKQGNAQLERVGHTGTYRLHVPLLFLGDGHLRVNLTVNIYCINNRYRYSRYQCGCYVKRRERGGILVYRKRKLLRHCVIAFTCSMATILLCLRSCVKVSKNVTLFLQTN